LNLSSLKASSAYTYFSPLAINQSSYFLNIGAPYSTAYPVGMADLISKRRFLAAYFTLGHAVTLFLLLWLQLATILTI
jgi:hypothetical protein